MAAKKGAKKPQFSPEEKAEIVERICLLYESQNATIESCCEAVGIADRTFLLWRSENAEFADRFKKAKAIQDENYWQDVIRPLGKRAIQKHLEVEFAEEEKDVVYEGVKTGEIQKTKKWILPNPTVTIFAMKGLYPEMFVDRHEHTGKNGGDIGVTMNIEALTTNEKRDLLRLLEKTQQAQE